MQTRKSSVRSRKPKRKTPKGWKKELDPIFSLIIRSRGVCQAKGKDKTNCAGQIQCCHMASRRYMGIRWDEKNALAMCGAHHTYYTMRPEEWTMVFLPNNYPDEWNYVREQMQHIAYDVDYEAVKARLTERYKEVTNG